MEIYSTFNIRQNQGLLKLKLTQRLSLNFLFPRGCPKIMKLQYLGDHVGGCEYNSNLENVCDNSCNMIITQRDYEINNCFSFLANRVSA